MVTKNDWRKDLVDDLVRVLCIRLKIDIPIVYYSIKDYHDQHPCCDWSLEHLYGISCLDCKCICVDLDDSRHKDILVLADTVAHELLHLKYEDVDHPAWFNKRVEKLLRGKKIPV